MHPTCHTPLGPPRQDPRQALPRKTCVFVFSASQGVCDRSEFRKGSVSAGLAGDKVDRRGVTLKPDPKGADRPQQPQHPPSLPRPGLLLLSAGRTLPGVSRESPGPPPRPWRGASSSSRSCRRRSSTTDEPRKTLRRHPRAATSPLATRAEGRKSHLRANRHSRKSHASKFSSTGMLRRALFVQLTCSKHRSFAQLASFWTATGMLRPNRAGPAR